MNRLIMMIRARLNKLPRVVKTRTMRNLRKTLSTDTPEGSSSGSKGTPILAAHSPSALARGAESGA
eukprot:3275616-Heterocapsa_arctica.AAC.1